MSRTRQQERTDGLPSLTPAGFARAAKAEPLAEELIVLFVGFPADADRLASLLALSRSPIPAHVTPVSSWQALRSMSGGWDVVVAGGPEVPAQVQDVCAGCEWTGDTPVLAVAHPPWPETLDRVHWFSPEEAGSGRLLPLLRAVRRAVLAEGRLRQLALRAEGLEHQLRQAGRLQALGQMAAGVAHEFNNVLTAIGGFCEQLLPQVEGRPQLERLVLPIRQAGLRGAELSQRVLLFSRRQVQEHGDASLTQVVGEATAMLVPLLGETVSTRVHLDQSLPRVRGHAGQLVEILTNLAVNARDAMPGGGVITIETRPATLPEAGPEGAVALVVSDTGVGMDAETLARACDPFFTTKALGAGTGLGLSLVRDLVEQSGGTLHIESTPGLGTTVSVTLPGVRPDTPAEVAESQEAVPRGGFETVLVVEDDPSVREVVTQFLRGAAYHVLEARDSEEAVAIAQRDPRTVDLLVTDIVLPGMSGPELAGRLRDHAPQMRTLFISGYPADAVDGERPRAFLAKPFSRAAFLQAVRRALRAPRHRDIHGDEAAGRLSDREREISEIRPGRRPH